MWHWLTPVAACVLTLMVAVHGSSRRLPRASAPDDATFFGTVVFNAANSNVQQIFVLSKMDENLEWNVWPHPLVAQAARWSMMPANR